MGISVTATILVAATVIGAIWYIRKLRKQIASEKDNSQDHLENDENDDATERAAQKK